MPNRPCKYRDLLRHLRKNYEVWEDADRAKGSERMWFRETQTGKRCVPVTYHKPGQELGRGLVGTIRRRLFPDGIDDSDFYP